jgi:group I intron endonuclease
MIYGFIYLVENLVNGKMYVGQTTSSSKRESAHLCGTSQCPAINAAVNKYGRDSFDFVLLEACSSIEQSNDREIYWINTLNTLAPYGYNIRDGGEAGGNLPQEVKDKISQTKKEKSYKHTEETKRKIGEASKGNKHASGYRHTEETKNKIRKAAKGREFSDEHKENLRLAAIGRTHSKKTKEKLRNINKGKTLSQEVKEKISKAHKGRKCWYVGLPKERHPRFGKIHSEETKLKISLSKRKKR